MYVHKYVVDSEIIYRLSPDSSKPAGSVVLNISDWTGKVPGTAKVKNGLQLIENSFAKPEEPKELKEEVPEKIPKEEKEPKEKEPKEK